MLNVTHALEHSLQLSNHMPAVREWKSARLFESTTPFSPHCLLSSFFVLILSFPLHSRLFCQFIFINTRQIISAKKPIAGSNFKCKYFSIVVLTTLLSCRVYSRCCTVDQVCGCHATTDCLPKARFIVIVSQMKASTLIVLMLQSSPRKVDY